MLGSVIIFVVLLALLPFVLWNWRPGKRKLIEDRGSGNFQDPNSLRPLGLLERWYSASHDSKSGLKVSFVLELQGPIPPLNLIEDTLSKLAVNRMFLGVNIKNDEHRTDKEAYFCRVDATRKGFVYPLETVFREDDQTWKRVVDNELHNAFDLTDPDALLWKVILISSSISLQYELLFCFHHTAVDGMAGIHLVQDFLFLFGTKRETGAPEEKLPPPIENVLDIRPTLGKIIRLLFYDSFPRFDPSRKVFLGPPHVDAERHSLFTYISLTEEETEAVKRAAKDKQTTFHGALSAAAHFALAKNVGQPKVTSLISNAVNLRKKCVPPLPDSTMGAFVCGPGGVHTISGDTSFWRLARECKDEIESNTVDYYQTIGVLNFLTGSWKDFFARKAAHKPNGRHETLSISNLGQFNFPSNVLNGSKLNNLWFVNTRTADGPLYNISAVTVDRKFHCTITAPSPPIDQQTLSNYGTHLKNAMIQSTQDSGFTVANF
eukprot:TRINITY_DN2373_c0_g2_i1.p1 TRINITY_DN2373_c0_g2~~TRINITY_DN2373_c0_g2_i1.p1  ORF type:complete len:490 (-),score=48.59 TRINITY_DN2373_c0_g2_i1:55-1524(-)